MNPCIVLSLELLDPEQALRSVIDVVIRPTDFGIIAIIDTVSLDLEDKFATVGR
jgi:hypothetical protein